MIRNLIFPTLAAGLAAALLGGCATSGYQYRGGNGDYYYGQPSVQYRDYGYGQYGDAGYGYPGGWSGSIGYGYGYGGSPYGYGGYGGYGYPYGYGGYGYPYYPSRPPIIVIRPGSNGGNHNGGNHDNGGGDHRPRPPWRNLGGLHPPQPPGEGPLILPERPTLAVPFPRERRQESQMQAPARRVLRERDDRRNSTP